MGIWVLAAVGSGLSQDFWSLLIARMFVGAGAALFLSVTTAGNNRFIHYKY